MTRSLCHAFDGPTRIRSNSLVVSPDGEVEILLAGLAVCLSTSLGGGTSDRGEPECCRHRSLSAVACGEPKRLVGFGQSPKCEVGNRKMPRVHGPNRMCPHQLQSRGFHLMLLGFDNAHRPIGSKVTIEHVE